MSETKFFAWRVRSGMERAMLSAAAVDPSSGMMAPDLLEELGDALVGRTIVTPEYGDWPGGRAVVTEVRPDPECPDICFTVRAPNGDEIGVLENEQVILLSPDTLDLMAKHAEILRLQ